MAAVSGVATGEGLSRIETLLGAGFQWSLDSYDKTLLNLKSDQMIDSAQSSDRAHEIVGAPSEEQWTFTTLKAGTTTIKLTNFRPFEPKPTSPTFTVSITVQ